MVVCCWQPKQHQLSEPCNAHITLDCGSSIVPYYSALSCTQLLTASLAISVLAPPQDSATPCLPPAACTRFPQRVDAASVCTPAPLQVLSCNIFALVRHAAVPSNLTGLRELHLEMVGSVDDTHLSPAGLPTLPGLTKLVLTLDMKVSWLWIMLQ